MLFPAFSKLNPERDKGTLLECFPILGQICIPSRSSCCCSCYVCSLSLQFQHYLGKHMGQLLCIWHCYAVNYLFTAFGNLSTMNFIIGQGKTAVNLYLTLTHGSNWFPARLRLDFTFWSFRAHLNFNNNWSSFH